MKNVARLKILFVVDEMPSISTPFILNQIVGILNKGHEVSIWSRRKGSLDFVHEEIEEYSILEKTVFLDDVPNDSRSRIKFFFRHSIRSFFTAPKLFLRTLNFLKFGRYSLSLRLFHEYYGFHKSETKRFDVIHAQFGPLGLMIQRLKDIGLVKGKLITQFRGYDVSKLIRFEGKDFYKYLFKKGDYFLANSIYFKNKAIELGAPEDRIEVQYSGVIVEKFLNVKENGLKGKNDFVKFGSVGRLSGKKGYRYCLTALKELKEEGYNFDYGIIGDGELKADLLELTTKLDLNDEVKFLGSKPHSDIADFLKEIDVFISHNVTSDEGDQDAPVNTLKEAMLSGPICFSTFHGGIPELIKDGYNGFLTPEKDSEALVASIKNNFYDSKQLSTVAENARATVLDLFNNDVLNDKLEEVYFKLSSINEKVASNMK